MKVVLLPVATITVLAAACCCCGDYASQLEGLGIDVPDEGTTVTVTEEGAAATTTAAPSGEVLAGTCGRFKEMSLKAPAGMTVLVCSEGGGADSITLSGGSDPGGACKVLKDWATAAGYEVEVDANAMGSYTTTLKKGTDHLSVVCTDLMGSTTATLSFSTY